MYLIDVDKDNKFLSIEMAGHMDYNEVKAYTSELEAVIRQFGLKEVRILINFERLDPIPQECVPELIRNLSDISIYANKVGSIHRRVVTRMQMERVINSLDINVLKDMNIKGFPTKREAMAYLNGR